MWTPFVSPQKNGEKHVTLDDPSFTNRFTVENRVLSVLLLRILLTWWMRAEEAMMAKPSL